MTAWKFLNTLTFWHILSRVRRFFLDNAYNSVINSLVNSFGGIYIVIWIVYNSLIDFNGIVALLCIHPVNHNHGLRKNEVLLVCIQLGPSEFLSVNDAIGTLEPNMTFLPETVGNVKRNKGIDIGNWLTDSNKFNCICHSSRKKEIIFRPLR